MHYVLSNTKIKPSLTKVRRFYNLDMTSTKYNVRLLTCELEKTISQRTLTMIYMSYYTEVPDLIRAKL